MSLLEVRDLVSGYGDMIVLNEVSVNVDRGQCAVVIGPNGAGKTTLVETIIGFVKSRKGKVIYGDKDITNLDPASRMRETNIAFVPEEEGIFPEHSVRENLEVMMASANVDRGRWGKKIEEVAEVFPRLGGKLSQRAGSMSGGEQKMLYLSNGLVKEPDLMIIDEISLGLQPNITEQVLKVIDNKIVKERGISVFATGQNARSLLELGAYAYVLEGGEIRKAAEAKELRADEEIIEAYLGVA